MTNPTPVNNQLTPHPTPEYDMEHDPFTCPECGHGIRCPAMTPRTAGPDTGASRVLAVVDRDMAVEYLTGLHDAQRMLAHEVQLAVGYMRAAGMTWADVAEGMGMNSKQAAEKRYRTCGPAFRVWRESADGGEDELTRLGRRMGIRAERVRYVVERDGVEVSRHYFLSRAILRAGVSGEVYRWDPRTDRRTLVH